MRTSLRDTPARAAVGLAFLLLAVAGGCAPAGPKTHPVNGRVEVAGGDVAALAGSTVEAALDSDPTVRAAGEIQPDGRFTLETLQAGEIRKGAVAGTYRVRIVLADDDPQTKRLAARAVDRKALSFDTSGLALQVPAAGEVTLTVPARK